jgi:hypothetical protein
MMFAYPLMTHRNQIALTLMAVRLESKGPGGRFPAFGLSCRRKRGALEINSENRPAKQKTLPA